MIVITGVKDEVWRIIKDVKKTDKTTLIETMREHISNELADTIMDSLERLRENEISTGYVASVFGDCSENPIYTTNTTMIGAKEFCQMFEDANV